MRRLNELKINIAVTYIWLLFIILTGTLPISVYGSTLASCTSLFSTHLLVGHLSEKALASKELTSRIREIQAHWHKNYSAKPRVEFIKVKEVADTYVAVFSDQRTMNLALARASIHIEKGQLQNDLQHADSRWNRMINGHDLKAKDLREHWRVSSNQKVIPRESLTRQALKDIELEAEFWQSFALPFIKKKPNSVLLAVSVDRSYGPTLSHELLHAQYFKNKKFDIAIQDFWQTEVSNSDKVLIKKRLESYYDANNENLIRNEFQAYILMNGAKNSSLLSELVDKYREPLIQFLEQRGVSPVQLQ